MKNILTFSRFIAHIKVTIDDLDVSLSILRSVGKMAKISIPKVVAYDVRPHSTMFVEKLQEEIERLKRELYINEMFFHQESSMNVSAQRAHQIRNDFLDFLNGSISDIELISLAQSQVLTKIMKDFYTKWGSSFQLNYKFFKIDCIFFDCPLSQNHSRERRCSKRFGEIWKLEKCSSNQLQNESRFRKSQSIIIVTFQHSWKISLSLISPSKGYEPQKFKFEKSSFGNKRQRRYWQLKSWSFRGKWLV